MDFNVKSNKIEDVFPLWKIEDGFLVSRTADITICYELELPQIFTREEEDYNQLHRVFTMAFRDLPDYTIVHKQDVFSTCKCHSEGYGNSFFAQSYGKHFNGRKYLKHRAFLYVSLSSKSNLESYSTASSLCKNRLVPKMILDETRMNQFKEAVKLYIYSI